MRYAATPYVTPTARIHGNRLSAVSKTTKTISQTVRMPNRKINKRCRKRLSRLMPSAISSAVPLQQMSRLGFPYSFANFGQGSCVFRHLETGDQFDIALKNGAHFGQCGALCSISATVVVPLGAKLAPSLLLSAHAAVEGGLIPRCRVAASLRELKGRKSCRLSPSRAGRCNHRCWDKHEHTEGRGSCSAPCDRHRIYSSYGSGPCVRHSTDRTSSPTRGRGSISCAARPRRLVRRRCRSPPSLARRSETSTGRGHRG